MPRFDFFNVPRIVFGPGVVSGLADLISASGQLPLMIHNADTVVDRVQNASKHLSIYRQRGEPTVEHIDEALKLARHNECDCVIGLGGGSAIDAAKAVAGLITNRGTALDYMEVVGKGQKISRPAAPWIAIPTTAGTGAEATRNAVIGLPEKRFKASIRSELLLPRIALIDPELHVEVPPEVTARSGMDALCQCIESYTSTGANALTDPLALHGVELAGRSLRRAFENGADIDARQDMALAALLSGITLTNAGLGAVHGFAAPLGASFPVPHGTVCAALLPHVIEANIEALRGEGNDHPTLVRYRRLGVVLSPSSSDPLRACVEFTARLARDLQIPPLSRFGIAESDVPAQVALAKKASSMKFNPVVLADEVLAKILTRAIQGSA